jgi:hypothetical protein
MKGRKKNSMKDRMTNKSKKEKGKKRKEERRIH